MSSLPKSTHNTIPSISGGQILSPPPAVDPKRKNVEISKSIVPPSSRVQYPGGAVQEMPVMVLNNEIISMLTIMD